MPAPTTSADLLILVRRSDLVAEAMLDGWLQRLPPTGQGGEPAALAAALVRDGLLTHFQAEQLLLGKTRGFAIGNFKILERIGSGGMALVYLCDDPARQRRVAVKVLPVAHAQDEEFLKRFYRESRVTAALEHPNIVRTYDAGHDGKVNFIVMEYVDGATLQAIVHKFGPMAIPRAAHYIRQAALGLQQAHEAGLVHRDIKPGNLIVDRSGVVKVMDMGLARIFEDTEEILTRTVLGTPDYVAPEQSKDSHNVDIRADLYSLGCSFYYLLSGGPPFPEGSVAQKFTWHQTRQPRPIRALRPEVPEGLAAIVHRLLAKDPAKRFQTPAEVAEALVPWTQTPIPPPAEEELPRLSPAVRATRETAADLVITPIDAELPGRVALADLPIPREPSVTAPATPRHPRKKEAPPTRSPNLRGPATFVSGRSGKGEAASHAHPPKTNPRMERQPRPFPWMIVILVGSGLGVAAAVFAWWLRSKGVL